VRPSAPHSTSPPRWRRYLRFWGNDPARDLDDELRFHLQARYDEYLALGMDPAAARAEADRRFGDVGTVRQRCAEIDSQWEKERTVADFVHVAVADLRYAVRQLRRNLSLSIAAILCFALGIGANTSIFSVVDAVLFRPLPFPESERLVLVGEELPAFGGGNFGVISTPEYADYKQLEGRVFESSAIYDNTSFTVTGGGEPERVTGAAVSASLFKVLRVNAALGRTFLPDEDQVGKPSVVVLSDALWRRRFNADTTVVGRPMVVNGVTCTIIGVMSSQFVFPLPGLGSGSADLFEPYWITPAIEKSRGNSYNTALIARLAPDVTLERATRDAQEIATRLPQMHPDAYGQKHTTIARVFSLRERATGEVRRPLLVLLAAVGLVLLIACINVSSLLLAHAATRQREISVRRALGASRSRLVRQFVAESLVLVTLGGALGVAFAVWGAGALAARAPRAMLQGYQISVDARVLLITAGIAVVTALLVSVLPAFQGRDSGLAGSLRDEGRSSSGSVSRQRARRALVISEIALALVVATGAGLMVKSFLNARNVDPGFNPSHLAAFRLGLSDNRYPTSEQVIQFEKSLVERLRGLPGVTSATVATAIPMSGVWNISVSIEGRDLAKIPIAANTLVFPDYFETMHIPLRAGQSFRGRETAESPPVAIINETMARRFFPGVTPVGKRIKWGSPTSPSAWATIVGVAADVKGTALDAPVEPAVYFPALQSDTLIVRLAMRSVAFIARTSGDPASVFNAVRRIVKDADAELPVIGLRSVDDIVSGSGAGRRFNTALLGAFAILALVLAAVGIYGLMAYSVAQRTREIGIRLAVGATPVDVLRLVVGQAIRVASIGVALGVAGSLLLTRVMGTLLFDVSPLDPWTLGLASALLFAVAGVASYLPARRAARIDPQTAIRAE